jgi:hypothetical protein
LSASIKDSRFSIAVLLRTISPAFVATSEIIFAAPASSSVIHFEISFNLSIAPPSTSTISAIA